jgi:ABC-type uncharacterized transport system permease subunit
MDGWFTLGAGVLIVVWAAAFMQWRIRPALPIVLSALVALLAGFEFADLRGDGGRDVSYGLGLWLLALGALLALVASVVSVRSRTAPYPEFDPED